MVALDSLKPATKASFGGKNTLKIYIFMLLFQSKTEQCDQKKLSWSNKSGMLISGLDTYFLEVSAHTLLKVATETSFSGKKSGNLAFLGYFFRGKYGGVWLLFFFHTFGTFLPCSDIFLPCSEVSAPVFCTQYFFDYW